MPLETIPVLQGGGPALHLRDRAGEELPLATPWRSDVAQSVDRVRHHDRTPRLRRKVGGEVQPLVGPAGGGEV